MKQIIYADNAATTKLDEDALQAMLPWLQTEYGNASQPYSFSRKPKKAIAEARKTIAACIGAQPDEIYFTSGGTESDNWAIKGMMVYGDHRAIVTSEIEHHAVLNACRAIERLGYPVAYLPVEKDGTISIQRAGDLITHQTKLCSVMMVNNEIGTIEPIKELANLSHQKGALFHTDAVQAVGHIPIDVKMLNVDMLSASAHKFNGPKGVGFLYIKHGTEIQSLHEGGAQEFGMRAGTENVAAIVAMAVALRKNSEMLSQTTEKLQKLEQVFLSSLCNENVDFIRNGAEVHVPGNVNISLKGVSGEMILHRLDLQGISISTGSACDSVNNQVSHVIQAIQVPEDYAEGTVRISFGRDNTIEDAISIAQAIKRVIGKKHK